MKRKAQNQLCWLAFEKLRWGEQNWKNYETKNKKQTTKQSPKSTLLASEVKMVEMMGRL